MIFLSFKIKESNFWWATNAIREPTACTIAYITNGVILLKSSRMYLNIGIIGIPKKQIVLHVYDLLKSNLYYV